MWNRAQTCRDRNASAPTARCNALVQPNPLSPSKQPLNSTWIFKTFRWNKAEETSGFLTNPHYLDPPRHAITLLPVHPEGLSPGPIPPAPDHLHTTPSALKGLYHSHCSPLPCTAGGWRRLTQPSAWAIAVIALSLQRGVTRKPASQESFWDHSSWKWTGSSAQRPTPRLASLQAAAVELVLQPQKKHMSPYCTKA